MHYVVALGNPGEEYEKTRHNVGFLLLDFVRVRVGIAPVNNETGLPVRPSGNGLGNYVLNKFSKRELEELDKTKVEVKELIEMILTNGVTKAMNKFNQRQ